MSMLLPNNRSEVRLMKHIVRAVEVIKGRTSYRWRLLASNGECLAVSEVYSSRRKCLQTAKKVAYQLGLVIKQL